MDKESLTEYGEWTCSCDAVAEFMAYAHMTVEQDGAAGHQERGKRVRELIRQFREIKKKEEEDASEVEGAWRSYTRVWEKKNSYYEVCF